MYWIPTGGWRKREDAAPMAMLGAFKNVRVEVVARR